MIDQNLVQNLHVMMLECEAFTLDEANARCFGYYGCNQAAITTNMAICSGAYGCSNANGIDTDSSIFCVGYKSCIDSGSIVSNTGSVYCTGSFACDSDVPVRALNGEVLCNGPKSCLMDEINSKNVYCGGVKACYGTDITSGILSHNLYILHIYIISSYKIII